MSGLFRKKRKEGGIGVLWKDWSLDKAETRGSQQAKR